MAIRTIGKVRPTCEIVAITTIGKVRPICEIVAITTIRKVRPICQIIYLKFSKNHEISNSAIVVSRTTKFHSEWI